jgi:hypothetical protein
MAKAISRVHYRAVRLNPVIVQFFTPPMIENGPSDPSRVVSRDGGTFCPRHPFCQAFPVNVLLAVKWLRFERGDKVANLIGCVPMAGKLTELLASTLLLLGQPLPFGSLSSFLSPSLLLLLQLDMPSL